MTKKQVIKMLHDGNIKELRKEAIKRGYISGTFIDYGLKNIDPSVLGNGEFKINIDVGYPILIKYDGALFDTIFDENNGGWTKIVSHK